MKRLYAASAARALANVSGTDLIANATRLAGIAPRRIVGRDGRLCPTWSRVAQLAAEIAAQECCDPRDRARIRARFLLPGATP